MTHVAWITIAFSDWWLSGTGAAGIGDVDAVPHVDRHGCPAMPMSQVKGQLRETAGRLVDAGADGWTEDVLFTLFGRRGQNSNSEAGVLAFRGDATLDASAARWFAWHPIEAKFLTHRISSTAIGRKGAALDQSLRAVEAAVPMTIRGTVVSLVHSKPTTLLGAVIEDWVALLDQTCAATVSFGKLKADGYGRAIARCVAAS